MKKPTLSFISCSWELFRTTCHMLRQTPSLLMLFFSEMTSRRRMVHFLCKNLEIIWGTCIPESEEPVRGMARMCAAYSGIIFTGKTPFDDQLFTIAMLHDLLASYSPTVKALLSLLKMFFGSVKTDWSCLVGVSQIQQQQQEPELEQWSTSRTGKEAMSSRSRQLRRQVVPHPPVLHA
jgi:hypothetical protein